MAIIRPDNDILTTGWSSTGGSFYTEIDETSASDSDYIESSTVGAKCRVGLETAASLGTTPTLTYRAASPDSGNGLIARVIESGSFPFIIPQRKVWTKQPQMSVGIDWSNRLTRGIITAYPSLSLNAIDARNKAPIVGIASPSYYSNEVNTAGRGIKGDGTYAAVAKGIYTANGAIPYHGLPEFSAFAVITLSSTWASAEAAVFRATLNATTQGISLGLLSPSLIRVLIRTTGTTGWSASYDETTSKISVGVPCVIGFSYKSGRRYVFAGPVGRDYDVFTRTAITGNISDSGASSGPTYIAGMLYSSSSSKAFPGIIHSLAFYKRALELPEINAVIKNPWQIFASRTAILSGDPGYQVIAERTPSLTTSPANYTIELTADEKAKVIDPANLGLEFETT